MGKKIKLREAQQHAADEALCARLRARSRTEAAPAFILSYADFPPCYRAKIEPYCSLALRAPEQWRCRLRVRSPEKRFLDLVNFTFAKYRVAQHLEQAWTDELHTGAGEGTGRILAGAEALERATDFCHWYILAAQGASLHREFTRHYLSRRETHYFLTAPDEVTSTVRAFWYAIAQATAGDSETAVRISRSKIAAFPVAWTFWRDAARYFARNPTSILEMNDLVDFFQAAGETADFSLSLAAMRRRMENWHRLLRVCGTACAGSWPGRALADAVYETTYENGHAVWRFHQIKSADALFREGQRMHHCVVSYKPRCMAGEVSIWSLTCEYPAGKLNRCITIEVARDGTIVQCRGFANRLPFANELAVTTQWAKEHGLIMLQ
jgi:PcfJ-like protein